MLPMTIQLPLFSARDRVPPTTQFSNLVIDGFKVVTASSMAKARSAITFARVTGSVGAEDYFYEIADPGVMPEAREIVEWAIVERL